MILNLERIKIEPMQANRNNLNCQTHSKDVYHGDLALILVKEKEDLTCIQEKHVKGSNI